MWDTWNNGKPELQFLHVSHIREVTLMRSHFAVIPLYEFAVWLSRGLKKGPKKSDLIYELFFGGLCLFCVVVKVVQQSFSQVSQFH